jgi:hypothetical protein
VTQELVAPEDRPRLSPMKVMPATIARRDHTKSLSLGLDRTKIAVRHPRDGAELVAQVF